MKQPVFFRNKEKSCILGLTAGNVEEAKKALGSAFDMLDETTAEGAGEKHLPVAEKEGTEIIVSVGSVLHPMSEEHSIEWVYLETSQGGQIKPLKHTEEPKVKFALAEGETAVAAYAYCNLHGFWKTEIHL